MNSEFLFWLIFSDIFFIVLTHASIHCLSFFAPKLLFGSNLVYVVVNHMNVSLYSLHGPLHKGRLASLVKSRL